MDTTSSHRHPVAEHSLTPLAKAITAKAASSVTTRTRSKALASLLQFADAPDDATIGDVSVVTVINYVSSQTSLAPSLAEASVANPDQCHRTDQAHVTEARKARRALTAIDSLRERDNLPKVCNSPIGADLCRVLGRTIGEAKQRNLASPDAVFDPAHVIRFLHQPQPSMTIFRWREALIKRTIMLLIISSGIRAFDASQILLTSVRATQDLSQRPLVMFVYTTKSTGCRTRCSVTEFVSDKSRCAATHLLEVRRLNEELNVPERHKALGLTEPRLFFRPDKSLRPYSPNTILRLESQLIQQLMPGSDLTAHSFRAMFSEKAALLGIPDEEVRKRAGWKCKSVHVTHYRGPTSATNIAEAMVTPLPGVE